MRILLACEESQAVCIEFRKLGHEAYSCDTQECSGGHPEWHIQGDVLEQLHKGWDLMIGFPPCTYISNAGAAWLWRGKKLNKERYKKGMAAREFFMKLWRAPVEKICLENPIPSKVFDMPVRSQIIDPFQFGDPYKKKTCLWLKNLPKLMHSKEDNLFESKTHVEAKYHWISTGTNTLPGLQRDPKMRSKTFPGIAKAMAEQWGTI